MKAHYKNISEALKAERPNDVIVKILNNKFAIVKCAYENGKIEIESSICSLDNNKIYFHGHSYKGSWENLKDWLSERIEKLPNTISCRIGYYDNGCGAPTERFKIQDNRKFKKDCKSLIRLLNNNL